MAVFPVPVLDVSGLPDFPSWSLLHSNLVPSGKSPLLAMLFLGSGSLFCATVVTLSLGAGFTFTVTSTSEEVPVVPFTPGTVTVIVPFFVPESLVSGLLSFQVNVVPLGNLLVLSESLITFLASGSVQFCGTFTTFASGVGKTFTFTSTSTGSWPGSVTIILPVFGPELLVSGLSEVFHSNVVPSGYLFVLSESLITSLASGKSVPCGTLTSDALGSTTLTFTVTS